ncbi:flagellar hook-associated protein FlgK [Nocardioides sp. BP30]|uniref:flagellar hook-associated protein FlgK n=1 Tax=Nocardioides sp. BP30 TaxID=3036374 RepID=UPI002469638D|nr:flagellar hook-associated protein FlgK [Nocardioides sp. BP30]WGL51898.1 flagellar hook-associated protein FlgK [Nocardioides sp. BP30]
MTGTFSSLNIAKTGLQYQQVNIDVADSNIANVSTDGYVRRRAVGAELGGTDSPTMYSSYTGHGDGVTTQSVQRLTDLLLAKRVRSENANLSSLTVQQNSLERLEAAVDEPSDQGVAKALSAFASAWQDAVTAPDGPAARQSVIAAGQTLAAAIKTQATAVDSEADEQGAAVAQNVTTINADLQQMAQLNHSIYLAQANGADVGALQDQRDQLALDLAQKFGAVSTADPATGQYNVTIGGATLVSGGNAGSIEVDQTQTDNSTTPPTTTTTTLPSSGTLVRNADGTAATLSVVVTPAGSTTPQTLQPGDAGGEIGGSLTLLNQTLSKYRTDLNKVASDLISVVNTQYAAGYDQNGNAASGEVFFTDAGSGDFAGSIAVDTTLAADPTKLAVSGKPTTDANGNATSGGNNNTDNADAIYQALIGKDPSGGPLIVGGKQLNVQSEYQTLVSGLGSTAAAINTQTANQTLLTNQVNDQLEQTAGVSLDEETISLMQAQRAYQASSRVLSVMDSILDTLINHTGA